MPSLIDWLVTKPVAVIAILLCVVGLYAGLVLLTRLAGLRSFSKMSSFDFAITVAIGSVVGGSVITRDPPLLQALFALAALFAVKMIVAVLRVRSSHVNRVVDNEPLLLMVGREILSENLVRARLTEGDLWAKLREANVLDLGQIEAVVMESTGDVSVLHRGEGEARLDPELLKGVRDRERFGD